MRAVLPEGGLGAQSCESRYKGVSMGLKYKRPTYHLSCTRARNFPVAFAGRLIQEINQRIMSAPFGSYLRPGIEVNCVFCSEEEFNEANPSRGTSSNYAPPEEGENGFIALYNIASQTLYFNVKALY